MILNPPTKMSSRSLTTCILIASIAIILTARPTNAAPRLGLCISSNSDTEPLTCDIVKDGVVAPIYQEPLKLFTNWPNFFLSIDPNTAGGEPEYQTIVDVIYRTAQPTPTTADWSLASENNGYIGPAGPNSTPLTLNSTLICHTSGWSNYSVAVNLPAPYDSFILFFQKQCVYPLIEIGTYTEQWSKDSDPNVVHDTQPLNSFSPWIFTSDIASTAFMVWLDTEQTDPNLTQQPFQLSFVSTQPAELNVAPIGPYGWSGQAATTPPPAFMIVGFTCTGTAIGDIIVNAALTFQWNVTIPFSFHYRCGVGTPFLGLNIGTIVGGGQDVVQNGRTVYPWNQTFIYQPDQLYNFLLLLNATGQTNTNYNVSLFEEDPTIFTLTPGTATSGALGPSAGIPQAIPFVAQITCVKNGVAHGLVQFELGNYIPIQLMFKFTCADPKFNVGDEPESDDLIKDSLSTGTVLQAGGNDVSATLFVMLDTMGPVPANPFNAVTYGYEPFFMQPYLTPRNGVATKTNANVTLTINFNCQPCIEAYAIPMTIVFYWGWSVPQPISLTKDCVLTDAQKSACFDQPSSSGWSTGGIVVFVLFLLITSFCISGCLYNRFKENKSGWEIIPGATTALNCVDNIKSSGRTTKWSPQDNDNDEPLNSRGSGYGAAGHRDYSTNL